MDSLYLGDFMIEDYMVEFDSSSEVNDTKCFVFSPVQDTAVEEDELFTFKVVTTNPLDTFEDGNNGFSLTIKDDDNM